jgi:hypothetical protein
MNLKKHEFFPSLIDYVEKNSIFVEIGSERNEGSTKFLGDLARNYGVDFYSVDIEDKKNFAASEEKFCTMFYQSVRDHSWPENIKNINELPDDLRNECIELHKYHTWLDPLHDPYRILFEDHVKFICSPGSEWAKNFAKNLKLPISLLYLDNFDYNWNTTAGEDSIIDQIQYYKVNFGIEMTNQNCQLEHFKQLLFLEPFLTENCVIGLDDTFLWNDCWVGKSGPGVVYLLALGYHVSFVDKGCVFLKK